MSGSFCRHKTRQGFTLVEATIVLGAIGLVLASIWVTYGSVTQRIKINTTTQQIAALTQGLHRLFPPNSGSTPPLNTDLAPLLISSKAVPETMINGAQLQVVQTPISVSYGVRNINTGIGGYFYDLAWVSPSLCLPLLLAVKNSQDAISTKSILSDTISDDWDECMISHRQTPPCVTSTDTTELTRDTPITSLENYCETNLIPGTPISVLVNLK